MLILLGWNWMFPPPATEQQPTDKNVQATQNSTVTSNSEKVESSLSTGQLVAVKTDVMNLNIDMQSGDIRDLVLTRYNATSDEKKPFVLFENKPNKVYVAQSGLLDANNQYIFAPFTTPKTQYQMSGDVLTVRLNSKLDNQVEIDKIYTFTKGSYVIGVNYEVRNNSNEPLKLSAMYRLLRDDSTPEGESRFAYTYTGPVMYTPEGNFEKVDFSDIAKNKAEYTKSSNSGWIGMIQHYFAAAWILQTKNDNSVCGNSGNCIFDFSKRNKDNLYSAGVIVPVKDIAVGKNAIILMTLYAGPQEYSSITKVANHLELVKDYGKVHVFAAPLFWLLQKLHKLVGNWGWAIILLVILVKIVLYPLNAAAYKSMAKMRAVAPKLQALKIQYGDDRMKMQQEMMALYKKEKISPLGGCIPMLIQIPVFLGLYWALLSSVELRQAPWIGWITDLARTDPYFILPLVMAGTMFLQTYLSPPPPDPMQAKMMKIIPIVFSVMFFFFPAGLVLYWFVNNILSIAQQWFINKQIEQH